jgi:hypothetical protein
LAVLREDPLIAEDGTEIENFQKTANNLIKAFPSLFAKLKGSSIRDNLSKNGKWIKQHKVEQGQQKMRSGSNEPVRIILIHLYNISASSLLLSSSFFLLLAYYYCYYSFLPPSSFFCFNVYMHRKQNGKKTLTSSSLIESGTKNKSKRKKLPGKIQHCERCTRNRAKLSLKELLRPFNTELGNVVLITLMMKGR